MKWKTCLLLALLAGAAWLSRAGAVWQWSVPVAEGRAFLWVPPACHQVRAVVLAQNNLLEPGLLEEALFRRELARLGIAEIFIAPPFETWQQATNNAAANARFDSLLRALAEASGYGELVQAPVIPLGHSALASFPWNFAAWNSQRTLAIVSIHGDAPQTTLTGNGQPNADWGGRGLDGIPGLMVVGEYEWSEERLAPAFKFRALHPAAPLAVLAEPGRGHFDCSEELVKFLALFIHKAAGQRLPAPPPAGQPPALKAVDPRNGWLVERWYWRQPRTVKSARVAKYAGDPNGAFWVFDRAMARATENYLAGPPDRLPQLAGLVQDGAIVPQTETHQQVNLKFEPAADGVTFKVDGAFLDQVDGGSKNTTRWTGLPAGTPLGHASGGGPVVISRLAGPVAQVNSNTFRVQFDRIYSTGDWRNSEIWLLAAHPGDARYQGAVQQALLKLPSFAAGTEQQLAFDPIPDQKRGLKKLKLHAAADSGRPVYFYVREGPAEVSGDTLRFTQIPPAAKFPVKVAVVAWQLGCAGEPSFKTATPVTREFFITR